MALTPAIILIVVAAIAGYVLGIVDSRITASMRKKVDENTDSSSNTPPQPAGENQNRLGELTALKVNIDQTLKWHLDLDNVQMDDPNTMSKEQRQRLVSIITQIRPWIDGKPAQPANYAANEALPSPAAAAPQPSPVKTPSLAIPAQANAANGPAPRIDAIRGLRSLLQNEIKSPSQTGISIVAMIDEVLQAKLMNSPLSDRSIRLEEGRMGEVIVLVGIKRYSSVDEVPEPEIRAIIKAAISDWEKK